jgi:hypothetical protein
VGTVTALLLYSATCSATEDRILKEHRDAVKGVVVLL